MPPTAEDGAGQRAWIPNPWARIQGAWREGSGMPLEEVTAALQQPVRFCETALFALARIGDPRAIPAVDALLRGEYPLPMQPDAYDPGGGRGLNTFLARAVAAQLRAVAAGPARDRDELSRQMRALIAGVGLVPEQVDQELAPQGCWPPKRAMAYYAAQQIADMALMAANRGIRKPASASPVNLDLSQHPPIRIKAQYSAFPTEERVERLVDRLTTCQAIRAGQETFEILLLVSERPPAHEAVVTRLRAMEQAREDYTPHAFAALLQVLACVGGPEDAEIARRLIDHPDPWLPYCARLVYEQLTGQGWRFWMQAY